MDNNICAAAAAKEWTYHFPNKRLFHEIYDAYKSGRAETWYDKGEIGFFDHYIIPLANKLVECGVFSVSSDEYLGYAQRNREEWERRGRDVAAEMVTKYIPCDERR